VCGQQKSLPWIKSNPLESPPNNFWVVGRMALEVLTFRSLFRNTKVQRTKDGRAVYGNEYLLWLGALAFHYSLLVILLRHFRFFGEPVPIFSTIVAEVDGFLQIGAPRLYLTSIVIVAGLSYLLFRRLWNPQVRYISLPSDYFALFLLLGVTISGGLMRYFTKVDVVKVKELVMSLLRFHPSVPEGIGLVFYIHLFLVCVLLAYFPVSKLMHMGGVFLSPTRNLANNSRERRHVNPWDYPVHVHTYEEWEDDFRDKLIAAGIPLDKKE
jgi:nitrate reductase gamma subunit